MRQTVRAAFLSLGLILPVAAAPAPTPDGAANALVVAAANAQRQAGSELSADAAISDLRRALDLLRRVIIDHPDSEVAVRLATEGRIGELDPAAIQSSITALATVPCRSGNYAVCLAEKIERGAAAMKGADQTLAYLLAANLYQVGGQATDVKRLISPRQGAISAIVKGLAPGSAKAVRNFSQTAGYNYGLLARTLAILGEQQEAEQVCTKLLALSSATPFCLGAIAFGQDIAGQSQAARATLAHADKALGGPVRLADPTAEYPEMTLARTQARLGDAMGVIATLERLGHESPVAQTLAKALIASALAVHDPAAARPFYNQAVPAVANIPANTAAEKQAVLLGKTELAYVAARLGDAETARRLLGDTSNVDAWASDPRAIAPTVNIYMLVVAVRKALGEGGVARSLLGHLLAAVPAQPAGEEAAAGILAIAEGLDDLASTSPPPLPALPD